MPEVDDETLIENQAKWTGAATFQQGVCAGAMIYNQGMLHGAELMASSDNPATLLEALRAVTASVAAEDRGDA